MYKIRYAIDLEKTLKKIPKHDIWAIESLAKDPRATGAIKLSGRDGYRVRVGDYRIIYLLNLSRLKAKDSCFVAPSSEGSSAGLLNRHSDGS